MSATSRMQFTFQACADINNIWESIAMPSNIWGLNSAEHLEAARRFVDLFEQVCHLLTLHPEMGPPRSELQDGIHSLIFERYVVFYRRRGHCVEVMRLLRATREVDAVV